MDVWRYSDWAGWTGGKQIRDSQPHIWRWRDWIVESLNADKPYDRMIVEMLAADELWPIDADKLRATGFLARNYKMLSRETWMQEAVNHTTQAFLGLTIGCARCHDHMYDPISQEEYYRLRAIFEPYKVRLDRLPTEPDTTKDGLARVYDADLEVATYLFRKGDDRDPDKDRPLSAGVLALVPEAPFAVQPVPLPAEAYYPGLEPHVQQQLLNAAQAEVKQAEDALKKANQESAAAAKMAAGPLDAGSADAARVKAAVAEKIAAAARLRLDAVKACIAADKAKYADPPAAAAHDLAATASKAQREAAFGQAAVDVAKAELKRVAALVALKPDDAKLKQALADADKALAQAKKKLEENDKARQEATAEYTPLTPVYPKESSGRRTALARWITDPRNPLTPRVAVNQMWMRHFGRPLVPTVLDFGFNGQPPTHPELLDWLAAELQNGRMSKVESRKSDDSNSRTFDLRPSTFDSPSAWDMKRLHRLIATSRTYRMASTSDENNLGSDPDNVWLWRMNSRRMEAELVRDGIFYVAGKLDLAFGGADIDYVQGLKVNRRSLYFRHAQEKQMEFLKMFDCAAVTECYQRKESIVPQQALALANSDLTLVHARIITRELDETTAADDAFVRFAFERVLARSPTADELAVAAAFLQQQSQTLAAAGDALGEPAAAADPQKPAADPRLRARENLVHVLLNHNDFVTIR
jgi:hypothetical protein